MKVYAPDYYKDFKCLAGRCKHSCCIGWEVDIDNNTLEYYKTVKGEMGERLKKAISYDDTPHFVMDENNRCPFLNSCGLCDIMTELGFDKVSYICDEHPRFYNVFSDRKEVGVGMSCETVAKMLVEKQDKTKLVCIENSDSQELWADEWDVIMLRERAVSALQNREKPVKDRLYDMFRICCGSEIPERSLEWLADFFLSLERLDEKWTDTMERLKTADLKMPDYDWFETALEQVAVYFAFRHFGDGYSETGCIDGAVFTAVSTGMIAAVCRMENARKGGFTPEDMAEIYRMYSAEIEYSEENVLEVMEVFLWDV